MRIIIIWVVRGLIRGLISGRSLCVLRAVWVQALPSAWHSVWCVFLRCTVQSRGTRRCSTDRCSTCSCPSTLFPESRSVLFQSELLRGTPNVLRTQPCPRDIHPIPLGTRRAEQKRVSRDKPPMGFRGHPSLEHLCSRELLNVIRDWPLRKLPHLGTGSG